MTQENQYTADELALIEQASIVAALVGLIGLCWPAIEIATDGVTKARFFSIALAVFAYAPFAAFIGIRIERYGLKTALSRLTTIFVVLTGAAAAAFALLVLVGLWWFFGVIAICAAAVAYARWPRSKNKN